MALHLMCCFFLLLFYFVLYSEFGTHTVFWDYYEELYVSVCADENEKWGLGRTGLCGGQAVPGHSFSPAPLSN